MNAEYFVDVERLRLHTSDVRQELRTAQQLYDRLATAKRLTDPSFASDFDELLRRADSLKKYFSSLAAAVESTGDDAEATTINIRQMIEDSRLDASMILGHGL